MILTITNPFDRFFARLGRGSDDQGVYTTPRGVLSRSGESAVITLSESRQCRRLSMANAEGSGIVVSQETWTEGNEAGMKPGLSEIFPLARAADAQASFKRTVAAWKRELDRRHPGESSGLRSRFSFAQVGLGFVAGVATTVAAAFWIAGSQVPGGQASAGQASAVQSAQGQLPEAARVPEPPRDREPVSLAESLQRSISAGERLAPVAPVYLSAQDVKIVVKAATLDMIPGSRKLIAFSDPLCPGCQDLERQSVKMSKTGFAVIPVAFQKGSRELVASVLCSSNPAQAWKDAMRGDRPSTPACEKGLAQVDVNNMLFGQIGGSHTPTLMSPEGRLVFSSADAPALESFVASVTK